VPGEGPGAEAVDTRLEQQARQALARRDAAAAAGGGNALFVPVAELSEQIGNFEETTGASNKIALLTGNVVGWRLSDAPPSPGTIRWADGKSTAVALVSQAQAVQAIPDAAGSHECQGCQPLEVADAHLSTRDIATRRGKATVPISEFGLRGTAVRITRVAVAPSATVIVTPPSWDPCNAPGGLAIESAVASADGRRLSVAFTGSPNTADRPCGAGYMATAMESANAIVIIIHASGTAITRPAPRSARGGRPLPSRLARSASVPLSKCSKDSLSQSASNAPADSRIRGR